MAEASDNTPSKLGDLFKSFTDSTTSQTTALQRMVSATESADSSIKESVKIQRDLLGSYNSMLKLMKEQANDAARANLYGAKPSAPTGKVGDKEVVVESKNGETPGEVKTRGFDFGNLGSSILGMLPRLLFAKLAGDIAGSLAEQAGKAISDYLGLGASPELIKSVGSAVDYGATTAMVFGLKAGFSVFAGTLISGAINSFLSDETKAKELANFFGMSITVEDVVNVGSIALGFGVTSLLKKGFGKLFGKLGGAFKTVVSKFVTKAAAETGEVAIKEAAEAATKTGAKGVAKATAGVVAKPGAKAATGAVTKKLLMDKGGMFLSEEALAIAGKKAAGEAAIKVGGKAVGETAAKAVGKSVLKKIPGIGAVVGLGLAADRAMAGDYTGAGLEALSGLLSIIPVVGTALSIATDVGLAARDVKKAMDETNPSTTISETRKASVDAANVMYGIDRDRQRISSNSQVTVKQSDVPLGPNGKPIVVVAPDNSTVVGGSSVVNNNNTTIVNNSINPAAALDPAMYAFGS